MLCSSRLLFLEVFKEKYIIIMCEIKIRIKDTFTKDKHNYNSNQCILGRNSEHYVHVIDGAYYANARWRFRLT